MCMINNNDEELKLKLSTLDCNTSTKYYQVTQTLDENQKHKIKSYFKYYTPEHFEDLDNVAGETTGWMCKSDDVAKVEELLEITETRDKYNTIFDKTQRKTANGISNPIENVALSFSK